ncbi:MAG TPA: DUF1549 domain-containing protein, partial [Planctomycetota bacterium]|nr:DUF1549 domain-containing protein [Planctomycetota bacterium]
MQKASYSQAIAGVAAALLPAFLASFGDDPQHTSARLTPAALDAAFATTWAERGLKPLGEATDAEWLRRASLALDGVVPTAAEVTAFLEDKSADKRSRKVDELLARHEYAEHWGGEWTTTLVGRGGKRALFDRDLFESWMVEQFSRNVRFDEL